MTRVYAAVKVYSEEFDCYRTELFSKEIKKWASGTSINYISREIKQMVTNECKKLGMTVCDVLILDRNTFIRLLPIIYPEVKNSAQSQNKITPIYAVIEGFDADGNKCGVMGARIGVSETMEDAAVPHIVNTIKKGSLEKLKNRDEGIESVEFRFCDRIEYLKYVGDPSVNVLFKEDN